MRVLPFLLLVCLSSTAFGEAFANLTYTPKPIEAKVPAYKVKADLSNVSNRKILPKLSAAQMKVLAVNGFIARPTAEEQLFYIYENNAYKKIGSFVTTDSVLHTYHIFYDFTLRYLEQERLFPAVKEISKIMLDANLSSLKGEHAPEIRTALTSNAVFFAVPLILLGEKVELPANIQQLVDGEIVRINEHKGREFCITGAKIDYTQFIPRGHYTRTEEFKKYFKAMMWYGLVPMKMKKGDDPFKSAILQALIITDQLKQSQEARELWEQLYDPTVFYVGKADDLSYYEFGTLSDKVFKNGKLDRFNDDQKISQFSDLVDRELPGPGIENFTADDGLQGKQFRYMGQRFIPDSRILQELTFPKVGEPPEGRMFPLGLDVFAVLGSKRAEYLLDNLYKQTEFKNYLNQRKKMQAEINALKQKDWQQNLYYGWMYCLLPLLSPKPQGYPSFMRTTAWLDKSLITSLGSWTELRHDTILYAKQSVAECGDGGAEPPPPVQGYVEPEVQVYERLSWLMKLNKAGLMQRKLISEHDELYYSFDQFVQLVDFLAKASRKELANQPLSKDELRTIERYGGHLENLMLSLSNLVAGPNARSESWWDIQNKTDRSMALVADVHTSLGTVLEEAVGNATEIWVVVPIQGKLVLTRGAMFTYYEFHHDSSDRLTDEAWQTMLQKGAEPAMPQWIRSFLQGPGLKTPASPSQLKKEQSGC